MLRRIGVLCLSLAMLGTVSAQTSPEIMEHYRAYTAAVKAKDAKTAAKKGYLAWQKAEEILGDHVTTAVLAQNFATASKVTGGKSKDIIRAYERSIALSSLSGEEAVSLRLEREVALAEHLVKQNKDRQFRKRFDDVIVFAEENKAGYSTFLGELYTLRSQIEISTSDHEDTEKYAERALEHFEKADDKFETYYPYMAHLYAGYGREGQDELIPAALSYQYVMEDLEGALPRNHPFMMRALGRWMTMRGQIVRAGLKDEATAAGMCDCWPYDKARNETVQPIKRVPPVMPPRAWQSGFSIVEFDLDDEGNTINQTLLESWPEKIWDKSSITAVEKWKYNPRTPEESDSDREDLIVTIRYMLKDGSGRLIE